MIVRAAASAALAALAFVLCLAPEPPDVSPPARPSSADRPFGPVAAASGTTALRPPPAAPVGTADAVPAPRPGVRLRRFAGGPRPGPLPEVARALVEEHRTELGLARMPGELRLRREFGSLLGWHLRLTQVVHGAVVYGSEVSAHVAPDGTPLLLNADVYPVEGLAERPAVGPESAIAAAREVLLPPDAPATASFRHKEPELMALPEGRRGRLVWGVDAWVPERTARVFVDATSGDPVRVQDLRRSAEGSAAVFSPNPCFTDRNSFFRDDNDADQTDLTAERVLVTLGNLDGSGYLRGEWVDVTATRKPIMVPSLDFTAYTRGDPGFEQVMAYYHLDRAQELLRSLGIHNVNAEPQAVDAHGMSADNSWYDPFTDEIAFGDGGVDDAEDADIIVHEYGHAIQDDQVWNFGMSEEGGAMGEGFGDFLAVAMHLRDDPLWDAWNPLVGSWDSTVYSTRRPPYMRRVDNNVVFPDDFVGEVHSDGEIWSRALWDLIDVVGRDDAVRLVVESHFVLTANADFVDGASAILLANQVLRGRSQEAVLVGLFEDRGIAAVPPSDGLPQDDDEFENNDGPSQTWPLEEGFAPDLVYLDEDWFRLTVPPNSGLHVAMSFSALEVNLDLQALAIPAKGGYVFKTSEGFGSSEHLDLTAGPEGLEVNLRVYSPEYGAAGRYSLAVSRTVLPSLTLGQTIVLSPADGGYQAFRLLVPGSLVDRAKPLKVTVKRSGGDGQVSDLRLSDPDGRTWVDFGEGRTGTGSKAQAVPDESGYWTLEVQARREPYSGPAKIKVTPNQ